MSRPRSWLFRCEFHSALPQLPDSMTTHPTVPNTCFWHKWVTSTVHSCRTAAPSHQHMRGVTEQSCVGQSRSPPRALGLQLPETAAASSKLAAVPASPSTRSSNNSQPRNLHGFVQNAPFSTPTSSTTAPSMLGKSMASLGTGRKSKS